MRRLGKLKKKLMIQNSEQSQQNNNNQQNTAQQNTAQQNTAEAKKACRNAYPKAHVHPDDDLKWETAHKFCADGDNCDQLGWKSKHTKHTKKTRDAHNNRIREHRSTK